MLAAVLYLGRDAPDAGGELRLRPLGGGEAVEVDPDAGVRFGVGSFGGRSVPSPSALHTHRTFET